MTITAEEQARSKRAGARIRLVVLGITLLGVVAASIERALAGSLGTALVAVPIWLIWFWLLDGLPSIRLLRGKD